MPPLPPLTPPPPLLPPPPRDDHHRPLPCSRRHRRRLCRRRLWTGCMIKPQSSMSKHIPVSVRRSAASRTGLRNRPPIPSHPIPSTPLFEAPCPSAAARPALGRRRPAAGRRPRGPAGWRLTAGGAGFPALGSLGRRGRGDGACAAGGGGFGHRGGPGGAAQKLLCDRCLRPRSLRSAPGGLRGVPRPLCLARRQRPARERETWPGVGRGLRVSLRSWIRAGAAGSPPDRGRRGVGGAAWTAC